MLIGPETGAEPAIIGQIDKSGRARPALRQAGKHRLITYKRREKRQAGRTQARRWRTGRITTAQARQLLQANGFEKRLERQIFAKRHQMMLVAARQ